ncbi:MAG: InlB B-repeat-containing protein, partial [Eubacterium sp.]
LNEKVGTADDYQNATFKLADGPSRAGYDFVGWSTRAAATKESYLANADGTSLITDYELKANTVAYAVWQVRDYTLTFHADDLGAFGMTEDTTLSDITYGKTIAGTAGAVYPAVPVVGQVDTEANKIFLGWSTMNPDDLPKDETDKQVGQAANFTADTPIDITGLKYSDYYGYFKDELGDQQTVIDLYPVLKNNTATVRFYQNDSTENGGKGAQLGTDITLTYGDPSPQAPAAVHDGYILRGWSAVDKEDFEPGAGKSYTSEYDALAAFDGEKDSYEWIAVWERAHTVTLMNNYSKEDSTKTEVPMIEDGTALGDKLMILSRDGYSFKGWSTVRDALVPNTEAKTPITKANTTLYAVWSTIPYSVTLYQNNSPEDTAVVKTITDQIWGSTLTPEELQVPTRAGYTFGGYNTARDGKGIDFIAKTDQAEGTKITADTALYAKWSKNPYILNVYKTPVIGAIPDQIITGIPYGEAIGDKFPTAAKYYTNAAGEKYVFGGFMDHTGKLVTAADSYAIGDLASDMGTLMAQYKTRAYDITGTKSGHGS